MQNKLFAILITALLVMLMAGSAMCATTYDSSVTLENKVGHPSWDVIDDGFSALIEYNAIGDEFEWRAVGVASLNATDYVLIYYADKNDRDVNWGGNNPGAYIGTIVTGSDGSFSAEGSEDLGINMPEFPDYNINPDPWDEYCNESGPDGYDNCCGAKLWMVPATQYNIDNRELTSWTNVNHSLFETDLIWYDDTDYNIPPEIKKTEVNESCVAVGDTVMVSAEVKDRDGQYDLENMIVTANMSIYGADNNIVLNYTGMKNPIKAYYSTNVTVTISTIDNCGWESDTSFDIHAEDPSGANDIFEAYLDVEPGECIMVIDGPVKAFTHGIVYLDVCCEDVYGNPITCCTDFASSIIGDASHGTVWDDATCSGEATVVDYGNPGIVTFTSCCMCGGERVQETHDITFMNQISGLDLTAEPEFVYNISECGEDLDCTNVSAQLIDKYGDPIPMPGIFVTFTINEDTYYALAMETNDDGTATFEVCMTPEYSGPIYVEATTRCITETIVIDVVDNELAVVEIEEPESPMMCGEEQLLTYTCYTDHGTEMCCPVCPSDIWTSDDLGDVDGDGYFTALDSGTAVVEINISGVTDTAEIVINCSMNCADVPDGCVCTPQPFVVTSGSVTLSGNFSEVGVCTVTGWACVKAIGDPIPTWGNDTRGAIVNVSEDRTEDVVLNLSGEGDTWKYNETTGNWSKYADGAASAVSNGTYALVTPAIIPDPCEGVTCEGLICVGVDRYNMTCVGGNCVAHMLVEANCVECGYDPCDGVTCEDVCDGVDLLSQVCVNGVCVLDALIEANCPECGYDPCDGVVCDDIVCVDGNCWNMTCEDGVCAPYMMIEECDGTICNGTDMYNMTCINCECAEYMLIEANCAECGYIPPTPAPTIRRSSRGGDGTYPPGWGTTSNATLPESECADESAPTVEPTEEPTIDPTEVLPPLNETVDETEDEAPGVYDPTNAILLVLGILALLVIGYVLYRKSQNGE